MYFDIHMVVDATYPSFSFTCLMKVISLGILTYMIDSDLPCRSMLLSSLMTRLSIVNREQA